MNCLKTSLVIGAMILITGCTPWQDRFVECTGSINDIYGGSTKGSANLTNIKTPSFDISAALSRNVESEARKDYMNYLQKTAPTRCVIDARRDFTLCMDRKEPASVSEQCERHLDIDQDNQKKN